MDSKKILKVLACLIFFILVVNFLAYKFYWYSIIWYLDMIMHFLGGFWLGLAYIWFFNPSESLKLRLGSKVFDVVFKILLFVFLFGFGWEVFEILINDVITQNPFNFLDTISDLCFDLSGGLCAILYVWKKLQTKQLK